MLQVGLQGLPGGHICQSSIASYNLYSQKWILAVSTKDYGPLPPAGSPPRHPVGSPAWYPDVPPHWPLPRPPPDLLGYWVTPWVTPEGISMVTSTGLVLKPYIFQFPCFGVR